MDIVAVIQNMQVMDCLRSGALVVAFLAVLYGNRRNKDGSAWLLVDATSSAGFGFAFMAFPDTLMGYMVSGKLDPVHLMFGRCYGAYILASSYSSFRSQASNNKSQLFLIRSLTLMVLFLTMMMAQLRSQKDGKQKFNDQHLTFAMCAVFLWMLGSMLQLSKCTDLGTSDSRGFVLRSHTDIHVFFDVLLLVVCVFLYYGFPTFPLSYVTAKSFKIDMIHIHLVRSLVAFAFGSVLRGTFYFLSNDAHDRLTYLTERIVGTLMVLPIIIWYQWWYALYSQSDMIGAMVVNGAVVANLAAGLFSLRKSHTS